MNSEPAPTDEEDISARGARYLAMIGLEDFAEEPFTHKDATYPAKDFLRVCGDEAGPAFIAFEELDPNDPTREQYRLALRGILHHYLGVSEPN